jgi:N-acetyl-anhydromuramyl-L-alanine amidase AmpD
MNAYSVGIEMVHVGGSGYYPEEQLEALDSLIAYIDAYYGFESTIIDHKAWRSGNSDTSPEFADYLYNYQTIRKHKA